MSDNRRKWNEYDVISIPAPSGVQRQTYKSFLLGNDGNRIEKDKRQYIRWGGLQARPGKPNFGHCLLHSLVETVAVILGLSLKRGFLTSSKTSVNL